MDFDFVCYGVLRCGMASHFIRKDSPFYWLRFRKADRTWGQRSSGVRIDAKGSLRKIHQMVAEETLKEQCEAEDGAGAWLGRWVPSWLEYRYRNRRSFVRCKNAWAHLSVFFEMRNVTHPSQVTYLLCHDYVKWRTNKDLAAKEERKVAAWNTAVMEMRVLGAIMQEALKRGLIIANPCAKLGLAKRDSKTKRVIAREEEALIYSEIRRLKKPEWMSECFLVAMKQGCRLMEVAVPMQQVNEKQMTITFNVKGGRQHTAPLHKDLLPLVKRARKEERERLVMMPPQASSCFTKLFRKLELDGLCFHCTRVTVVSRLCEAGFSESQTMAYVGHASELVHALYRKMRPGAVAKLGDVL